MRFVIYPDQRGLWRWRIIAANNRIVADSGEGYANKQNAERAVQMIQSFGEALRGADIQYETARSNGHKEAMMVIGKQLAMLAEKGKRWNGNKY